MPTYLFIYHAPATPADATPADPEQMREVMGQWNAWAEKVGDRMVDFGSPLAGGITVTSDGTSDSSRDVTGYTLIEAGSMDEVLDLARDHPHLDMPGGCTIEVHEAQPVPGA